MDPYFRLSAPETSASCFVSETSSLDAAGHCAALSTPSAIRADGVDTLITVWQRNYS